MIKIKKPSIFVFVRVFTCKCYFRTRYLLVSVATSDADLYELLYGSGFEPRTCYTNPDSQIRIQIHKTGCYILYSKWICFSGSNTGEVPVLLPKKQVWGILGSVFGPSRTLRMQCSTTRAKTSPSEDSKQLSRNLHQAPVSSFVVGSVVEPVKSWLALGLLAGSGSVSGKTFFYKKTFFKKRKIILIFISEPTIILPFVILVIIWLKF